MYPYVEEIVSFWSKGRRFSQKYCGIYVSKNEMLDSYVHSYVEKIMSFWRKRRRFIVLNKTNIVEEIVIIR